MFQILKDPKFDFMRLGKPLISASAVLVVAAVIVLFTVGLNLGIEFTGGTELQIKFAEATEVGEVRDALQRAGMTSQVVTTIGDPEEHEIYIRLGITPAEDGEASRDDLTGAVVAALREGAGQQPDRVDVNVADQATLERLLAEAPGMDSIRAAGLASAIKAERKDVAIFHGFDELAGITGMSPEVLEHLQQNGYLGPFALRSQSYIGPAIGAELLEKTKLAILLSLLMMLIYIWIRFQLQWGFAAVLALTHDTLITLGLFSLFGKEMSLPVVAAFLTLVGYSVNDTVVVFDRIRENTRSRAAKDLRATINLSINQTLGRTIITSGLTFVVVLGLFVYGGAALNAFAFVLTFGVIVGTYSSIYIASPILLLWNEYVGKKKQAEAAASTAEPPRAKKIRSPS